MRKYRTYSEARKFVHSLKLKKDNEWRNYCKSGKKPDDIPADPRYFYKKEWTGIGDWLGTGSIAYKNQKWRPYHEAKKFVHKLKLSDATEWKDYCKSGKKPKDIPVSPYNVYKKECKGIGDWLGTGRIANQEKKYRSFVNAKKFVQSLNFEIRKEWIAYTKSGKKPEDIPTDPAQVYKKEWTDWGDWLGTGRISTQKMDYLPFPEAVKVYRKLAKEYNLKNAKDWLQFIKKHEKLLQKLRIPATPRYVYSRENVWRKMKHGSKS